MLLACAPAGTPVRDRPTIAQIFRRFGDSFAATHPLVGMQGRVLHDIQRCRTPALGGHIEQCEHCGHAHLLLHSCRNRHCPGCQYQAQKLWLEQRMAHVLPIPYFHVVFTLPAPLRALCRAHPVPLYNTLFAAASQTLLTFGQDPSHLGAQLGLTAVLHTWSRDLQFHPHLHCIVTAGGLSDDATRWVSRSPRFLFPVRALSRVFRGKFIDSLNELFAKGRLPGLSTTDLAALLTALRQQDWNVFAKKPFGGAQALYSYLGRYTHRTGISDQRLISVEDEQVRFRTRGSDTCSLHPLEFIRRFLLHVLPSHFVKVRHYGLLAASHVKGRLAQARRLLTPPPAPVVAPVQPAVLAPPGLPPAEPEDPAVDDPGRICPRCQQGRMRPVSTLGELAQSLVAVFRGLASLRADTS